MDINLIKLKAFELAAAYQLGDSEQKKEARRRIKGLDQERRALLIQILNNPDVKIDDERLKSLDHELTRAYTRYTDPACKISRAFQNRWKGRVKSSSVMHEMAVARADYEAKLNKVHKPSENVEKKLEFFVTEPFAIEVLNHFLLRNRKTLTSFAFEHPDKWLTASKKICDKLKGVKKAQKIRVLLANLDRKINLFQIGSMNLQDTGIPKDILNQIASWLPAAESSIRIMQILYGGLKAKEEAVLGAIDPQIFASWMNTHNLKLHEANLPFEEIKKIAPYLDEIDLTHLGLGKHKSNTEFLKLVGIISDDDIPWISLFQKVDHLHVRGSFESSHGLTNLLENIKKVEHLTFFWQDTPLIFSKNPCYMQIKTIIAIVPSIEGIEHLQNLEALYLLEETKVSWKSIGNLPKLYHLQIPITSERSIVKQLSYLKKIRSINLGGPIDASEMKALGSLRRLNRLLLEDCTYDAENLIFLKNITTLGLDVVDDAVIKALRSLPQLKNLTIYDSLDTSLESLANLRKVTLKKEISFDNLKSLAKLPNLKELRVQRKLSDEERKFLQTLTHLKTLELT